jgi:hypothetical protein
MTDDTDLTSEVRRVEERVARLEQRESSQMEQEARIALLEHYDSLMQSYKIYLLTLAIGLLTVVEIWLRAEESASHQLVLAPVKVILSLISAAILASSVLCVVRWAWFGKIVESTVRAPPCTLLSPSISQVDDHIRHDMNESIQKTGDKWRERRWKEILRVGDCKAQLITYSVLLTVLFCCVILLSVTMVGG